MTEVQSVIGNYTKKSLILIGCIKEAYLEESVFEEVLKIAKSVIFFFLNQTMWQNKIWQSLVVSAQILFTSLYAWNISR